MTPIGNGVANKTRAALATNLHEKLIRLEDVLLNPKTIVHSGDELKTVKRELKTVMHKIILFNKTVSLTH